MQDGLSKDRDPCSGEQRGQQHVQRRTQGLGFLTVGLNGRNGALNDSEMIRSWLGRGRQGWKVYSKRNIT